MYVYFVLSPKLNLVKIGKANNVDARMKHLQTGCSDKLGLLAPVRNSTGEVIKDGYSYPKHDNKGGHNPNIPDGYTDDCQRVNSTPFRSPAYGLSPAFINDDCDSWSPPYRDARSTT